MADPKIYTVGWICAIKPEIVAARAFLDEEHKEPMTSFQHDNNSYTRGKMANHNVVIAALPKWEYGTTTAATVARDMLRTFPNIRIGLMVGVGGGVPSHEHDIRLGDVVVASRDRKTGGVFQYDYGRRMQDQPFETTGALNQPPQSILTAVASLESTFELEGHQLNDAVDGALNRRPRLRKSYCRPPADHDRLFKSSITHSSGNCSKKCNADPSNLVSRPERGEDDDNPAIHYGLIASANQLMKDAKERDLAAEEGVLCFEMEAAGLMNHFPCLVVRGICDYSDTHKNQDWQGFAAMMAAAYAKDLLSQIAPNKVEMETRLAEILESIEVNQTQQLQTINETKATVDAIKSDGHDANIRSWLSPPDTSTNSNHARESRHKGTGAWFLESVAFREWKLRSRRHLWLYGMPGSGKTVLSTTILDDLAQMDNRVTLEFFFDFNDIGKQKPDDMYRSLAFQLYTRQEESRKVLDDLLASHDNGRKQPTTGTLSKCLQAMIQVTGEMCIVLDALDECAKRTELLKWIQDFVSSPDVTHVQLLATGRPEEEFVCGLRDWVSISLEKEFVNEDIRSYIGARLQQSEGFKKWAPKEDEKGEIDDVLQMIQDQVGGKADGMFRWAACQLDSLETCLDLEDLEIALETLPQDLNATYDRMLKKTPEKGIRLLQLLVHSQRPLTLQEAVDAIAVRVRDEQCFKPKYRLPYPTDITKFCPSLVDLIEAPGTARAEGTLQLAHFTVKEYLLQSDKEGFRGNEAHVSITKTCLFYLRSVEEDEMHQMRTRFPLARYAAEIWMDNAGPAESSEGIIALIVNFLQSSTGFRVWARLFDPERTWDTNPGLPKASSLYYACLNGLAGTVRELLSKMPDLNAQGGRFGNALQAASYRGYQEIVRILLDKGADVNAEGGVYGNALQAASDRGYQEIVRMLLDKGADINAEGGEYGNALQAASYGGYQEIVRILLDKGADVNAKGGEYSNALQAASYGGYQEIVRMLLDKGADVNAEGGVYGNALQAASFRGHQEIVQMLLDKGADVNSL
ncbi:Ankyrin repeat domain-containing protein 50 [Colletotrichum fructicola]|nr:Ankyrin repeat domain-containing protein 50 [Colletotrichum fructicola]